MFVLEVVVFAAIVVVFCILLSANERKVKHYKNILQIHLRIIWYLFKLSLIFATADAIATSITMATDAILAPAVSSCSQKVNYLLLNKELEDPFFYFLFRKTFKQY